MKSLRPSKWSCSDFGLNNRQKSEQFQAFLTLVAYAMGVGRETTAEVSPTQRQVQLLGEFVLSRKVRRDRGAKFPNILERK